MSHIECYSKIIIKYFEQINQSNIPKKLIAEKIIYVGLNTISHIFSIYLEKMRNLDITFFYCDKAIHYYLEYIEQISNLHIKHDLNYNDAVIFVYSKTLATNLSEDTNNLTVNLSNDTTPINLLNSLHYSKDILPEYDLRPLLHNIFKITNCILNWNIVLPLSIRISIINTHLYNYSQVLSIQPNYIKIIEFINEKIAMNPDIYQEWLIELYKGIKRNKRHISCEEIDEKILSWSNINELPSFTQQYEELGLNKFCKLVLRS